MKREVDNIYRKDLVKNKIIDMLKKKFDINVIDNPIDSTINETDSLLFKGYGESENEIYVIDYDDYDAYNKETIVSLNVDTLIIYDKKYKIKSYDSSSGLVILDTEIPNLSSGNTKINVGETDNNRDFINVTHLYSQIVPKSANFSFEYSRYVIEVFLYNDLNGDDSTYYMREITKLFSKDFKAEKNTYIHIANPPSCEIVEENVSNKVVRGSILLRIEE